MDSVFYIPPLGVRPRFMSSQGGGGLGKRAKFVYRAMWCDLKRPFFSTPLQGWNSFPPVQGVWRSETVIDLLLGPKLNAKSRSRNIPTGSSLHWLCVHKFCLFLSYARNNCLFLSRLPGKVAGKDWCAFLLNFFQQA